MIQRKSKKAALESLKRSKLIHSTLSQSLTYKKRVRFHSISQILFRPINELSHTIKKEYSCEDTIRPTSVSNVETLIQYVTEDVSHSWRWNVWHVRLSITAPSTLKKFQIWKSVLLFSKLRTFKKYSRSMHLYFWADIYLFNVPSFTTFNIKFCWLVGIHLLMLGSHNLQLSCPEIAWCDIRIPYTSKNLNYKL